MTNFLLDGEEQEVDIDSSRLGWHRNPKIIFILAAALIFGATTLASNFSLSGGRIEYGQGLFKVKACDSWISIGLFPTAATYSGLSRVQSVELIGLDPIACQGNLLRFQFYDSSTSTALPMYTGVIATDTATASATIGSATILSVYDTSTAFSSGTYANYARKALTLVNQAGVNISYGDDYLGISYLASTGSWKINLVQPLCPMGSVYRITVESASLVA
jgi:hypothetical protein